MKKLSFLELEKEMAVLSHDEASRTKGGSGSNPPSWDCVLNCFDYLDDGTMNGYGSYYSGGKIYHGENQPYNPQKAGGIKWQDFHQVGANGGLNVAELHNPGITSSGRTTDGRKIMMTMPGANGEDHAVVITGTYKKNGKGYIEYHDPTTGKDKSVASSGENISGYYAVSPISTTLSPSTTVPTTTIPPTT